MGFELAVQVTSLHCSRVLRFDNLNACPIKIIYERTNVITIFRVNVRQRIIAVLCTTSSNRNRSWLFIIQYCIPFNSASTLK